MRRASARARRRPTRSPGTEPRMREQMVGLAEIGRRKHSTEPTSSICPWLCFSADFKRSGETIGKRRYISSMVSIGQSPMAPS